MIEDDPVESITVFIAHLPTQKPLLNGADGLYLAEEGFLMPLFWTLCCQKLNGMTVLKSCGQNKLKTPVLILAAKDALTDKLHGF